MSFENAPNLWTVGIMALVNALINAVVAPIWAILTTHLYLERTGETLLSVGRNSYSRRLPEPEISSLTADY